MSSEEILQTQYNTAKRIDYSKLRQKLLLEKIKQDSSGKDYVMSIVNNGRGIFNSFYYYGKNTYIDKLPTIRVDSNKTNANINNILAYLKAEENSNDVTIYEINSLNNICDNVYFDYLLQFPTIDYNIITGNIFDLIANGYTYYYSPITKEITYTKQNDIKVYEILSEDNTKVETEEIMDGEGYYNDVVYFTDLDSDVSVEFDDTMERKSRVKFVNKIDSNDVLTAVFHYSYDVPNSNNNDFTVLDTNPFNYKPYLSNSSRYNFNNYNYVDYTVNGIDKRVLFSDPDDNTKTATNGISYDLFNDPDSVSKNLHAYPVVTLRFRNHDIQEINEINDSNHTDTDYLSVVDGVENFFSVKRYKTTKSIVKKLGFKLKDLTDTWLYKDPKAENKEPNENISKVYSIFLFFGITDIPSIQEKIEGKDVTIDGNTEHIKGDIYAEVMVKYIYNMIDYLTDNSTQDIYIYVREIVHRIYLSFVDITKNIDNTGLPKANKIKYTIIAPKETWNPTGVRNSGGKITVSKDEGNKITTYSFTYHSETNIYMEIENGNGRHGKSIWQEYEPTLPLFKEIVATLSIQDQCKLLNYCTQLEMQTAYRQKLKWYQTVEFQTTMIVVGMFIAWIAPYFNFYLTPFIYIASQFVNVAIENPILKASLQIILIAIEIYSIDWSSFMESINVFEAVHLATIPVQIADILTQAYYGVQGNKLQKQINAFTTTAEDRLEYLESLDTTKLNNSYLMIEGTTLFGQDISPVLSGSSIVFLNNCYKNYNVLYQRGIEYFYDNLYDLRYDYNEN